ncbi:MAG: peptidase M50 [Herpetosiphonaceae bacterium]|nr:MAG: peptidase M50 [Herpetosiphonaceae bacterium]
MRSGFRIGRLFGINLIIDWSWLLIFLLVTWNLTVGFAQIHPDWSWTLRVGAAVVAALLFFASVLVHELAHSLVAQSQGLPVRNITLFLFGGVSNIQKEPPSAKAEFLIAIVGPISSFVLGGLLLLLGTSLTGGIGQAADQPRTILAQLGPVATMLLWLGSVNILLAIFNLIPGFPLDGGRVLRSILWGTTNDLRKATRWAAWVGQAIAWIFIGSGIAMVFGVEVPFFGSGLGGLWLAFIGWFLNSAAIQSYQQLVIQDLLEGVPVQRLMRQNVTAVPPDATVGALINDYLMGTDEQAFPVTDNEQLLGLVCLEDVRQVPRDAWETTTVRQIMTPRDELVTVEPQEDASDALDKLVRRDISQMPVMQNGHFLGLLRRRDIARWLEMRSGETAR